MIVVKHHAALHIIFNAACCWPEKVARSKERTHSGGADEGWMRRTIFTAPIQCGRSSSFCLHPTRLSWPCCQFWLKHLLSSWTSKVGWQLLAQAIHDPWWCPHIRKGNARSCCGQWTNPGVRLSKGAVAGHIKRAAALNARRAITRSTLNLWRHLGMASLT